MSSLRIFILCHNRPDEARRAIRSVLAQTNPHYHLVISDNSTDNRVEHIIRHEFPSLNYVRRLPSVPALEHFNRCLDETTDTHVCLFHDDDVLAPDFVETIHATIKKYPNAIAIGCNARLEVLGKLQDSPSFLSLHDVEVITSPRDLATRYFSRHQSGIAPFPGYVYHRHRIGSTRFVPSEGKYSDVAWLLRLSEIGPFVWVRRPLMTYRIHGENDGLQESRSDRLHFLAYLKRCSGKVGNEIIEDYRCSFVYKPLAQTQSSKHLQRISLAIHFLRFYSWRRYLRPSTYCAALKRSVVKRWGRT